MGWAVAAVVRRSVRYGVFPDWRSGTGLSNIWVRRIRRGANTNIGSLEALDDAICSGARALSRAGLETGGFWRMMIGSP